VLHQWLLELFGMRSFDRLAASLKAPEFEGFDENNVSLFHHNLKLLFDRPELRRIFCSPAGVVVLIRPLPWRQSSRLRLASERRPDHLRTNSIRSTHLLARYRDKSRSAARNVYPAG
jgi:hypothetical protein